MQLGFLHGGPAVESESDLSREDAFGYFEQMFFQSSGNG